MSKSVEERHEELLLSREQEKELFEEASRVFLAKVSREIRDLKSGSDALSRLAGKDEWVRAALVKMILASIFELDRFGNPGRFRDNIGGSAETTMKRHFRETCRSFGDAVQRWLEEDKAELVESALREIRDSEKYDLRDIYIRTFSLELQEALKAGVRKRAKEDASIAAALFLRHNVEVIGSTPSAAENNAMNIDTFREALHASRRKGIPNPEDDGGPDEGGA